MRQHEAVVQTTCPNAPTVHDTVYSRIAQSAARISNCWVRLIRRMRRHFEGPEFEQSGSGWWLSRASRAYRCRTRHRCVLPVRSVNRVAEHAVHDPGWTWSLRRESASAPFPTHTGFRAGLRRSAGAWLVGPMNNSGKARPTTKAGCSNRPTGCRNRLPAGRRIGLSADVGPPTTL